MQRFPVWDNRRERNELFLFVEQPDPCAGLTERHVLARQHVSAPEHLPVRDPFSPVGAETDRRHCRQKAFQRNPALRDGCARPLQTLEVDRLVDAKFAAAGPPKRFETGAGPNDLPKRIREATDVESR